MYLDYAENMALRRKPMTMQEWSDKLDAFLAFNEREVLTHAGKVSAQVAERLALERYTEFEVRRRDAERQAADAEDVAALERLEQQLDGAIVKKR
ncbi:Putative DNA-binding protein (fragment) [Cupriavidus taiwanensis]|uniref:DNA-binding protein n=2 Tax=Cupriavidus taiwanensis TaxID=164546 RepID=A0A375BPS4_9BURK